MSESTTAEAIAEQTAEPTASSAPPQEAPRAPIDDSPSAPGDTDPSGAGVPPPAPSASSLIQAEDTHAGHQGGHQGGHPGGHHGGMKALALGALGVVFGDIGTSPLYAMKECVTLPHGVGATEGNVLGILSLVFWALALVVSVKYLGFIMKADNEGEGGILALLALVPERLRPTRSPSLGLVPAVVLVGAALLYGDGIITPAISVLSAVEGLGVATHALDPAIVPITCAILVGLFAVQARGTEGIGRVFGPVMLVWFGALAVLGGVALSKNLGVLRAVNPAYAFAFFAANKGHGFALLGSVVLAITGGEALYADMGHFGRRPIQLAWYGLVWPALLINYFGQGANLLTHPEAAAHPFYALVPTGPATYVLVALATAATVIASQALITGAYSLTRQAIQLGYLPRLRVVHTSVKTEGQIYMPDVNWLLAIGCLVLVLAFRESTKLAAAYGIAVTGTMGITSFVYFVVARHNWGMPLKKALPLLLLFLAFDLPFFGANALKFLDGGYVPIVIALGLFALMAIWRRGRALLGQAYAATTRPLDEFIASLETDAVARVPGAAVFLTASATQAPVTLRHHVQRNRSLAKTVFLLTVLTERVPRVPRSRRREVQSLGGGMHRVLVRTGFMQQTDVPTELARAARELGIELAPKDVTYYLGRETLLATGKGKMGRVTELIFAFLTRNSSSATAEFGLPPDQVVELGLQLDL